MGMWTSTFMPMLRGQWYRRTGFTETGRDQHAPGLPLRYTPINMYARSAPTSIRTDKSGTKSRAEEATFDARVLIHPETHVQIGDQIEVAEGRYRVVGVFVRRSMHGLIHHLQVDLVI